MSWRAGRRTAGGDAVPLKTADASAAFLCRAVPEQLNLGAGVARNRREVHAAEGQHARGIRRRGLEFHHDRVSRVFHFAKNDVSRLARGGRRESNSRHAEIQDARRVRRAGDAVERHSLVGVDCPIARERGELQARRYRHVVHPLPRRPALPTVALLDEPHDASDTLGGTASEVNASSGHALPLSRRRRAEVRGHRDPLVDAARENRRGWRVGEYHASAAVQGNRICGCNNL